jgi:excisionase family DNA binding protein
MSTLPKLHRINDAAAALGVSRNTIYRLAREGKLVRIQIGENSSRITDDSIREFVVAGTVATATSSRLAGRKAAPNKGGNLHST